MTLMPDAHELAARARADLRLGLPVVIVDEAGPLLVAAIRPFGANAGCHHCHGRANSGANGCGFQGRRHNATHTGFCGLAGPQLYQIPCRHRIACVAQIAIIH